MSAESLERAEKKIDLDKLAQDFVDLADQDKFAEMLILAKQVKLAPRQLAQSLEQAIDTMDQKDMPAVINKPTVAGMAIGAALGHMLANKSFEGYLLGAAAGHIIHSQLNASVEHRLQKLREAKQWVEENS